MFFNMHYYEKSSVPHVVQPGNFILRKLVDWQPASYSVDMKNISSHSSCEFWDVVLVVCFSKQRWNPVFKMSTSADQSVKSGDVLDDDNTDITDDTLSSDAGR